jgi:hypothetical protein
VPPRGHESAGGQASGGEESGGRVSDSNRDRLVPAGKLGDPPIGGVTRRERPVFRVRFETDGIGLDFDDDGGSTPVPRRKAVAKTFFSEHAAYRWLARRMIFRHRDRFATSAWTPENTSPSCRLCATASGRPLGDGYSEPGECRYHDADQWQRLVDRLARWLRWRDQRRAEIGWAP